MAVTIPVVPKDRQVGWFIDVDRCIGCRACEAACKQENGLDVGMRWRKVLHRESGEYPNPVLYHVSMSCNHCAQPACIKACPHDAIFKRESDGIVYIDRDKCQGCQRCVWACPYGAPQFDETAKKAFKCHYCMHRIDQGLPPACVVTCMGLALHNGTLQQIEENWSTQRTFKEFADPTYTNPSIRWKNPRKLA
ncbi:MAG TPA: 4Fe-4S dicluster domain-containing protein [Candidatus Nitrosotenuis sp.]|jgi:anaerobic dimethyl sulfoxide reductase subunit B (iron-sulfur subunit)|nr:4Fe-4S dicluster domain-containing protein [Candidatus Nitrosotenuis sp.]